MVKYSCCEHCLEDPVHQDSEGNQLSNNHELPCGTWVGPWEHCRDGAQTA